MVGFLPSFTVFTLAMVPNSWASGHPARLLWAAQGPGEPRGLAEAAPAQQRAQRRGRGERGQRPPLGAISVG